MAGPAYVVLFSISFSHFLNDVTQSLLPAVYPILKGAYHLDFGQIGWITFAFQFTASLLQPLVGLYTDRHPKPYSLAFGMTSTFVGMILLSTANHYWLILVAAAMIGLGSSVFHPESSRVARLASGGRYGFAQSLFQVGGNLGTAVGPLLAAAIVVPFGQPSLKWLSVIAFAAIILLWRIGDWYKPRIVVRHASAQVPTGAQGLERRHVVRGLVILALLVFSKHFYLSSIMSYYMFYLIHKFGVSTQLAQIYLFAFLGALAAGVYFGGPLGDRFGRKYVIWFSILGVLPFTLLLPYVGLVMTIVLSVIIGFIIASAMPAIIVFAQELMPHRLGMISGVFFGFAFGVAGIGAAVLGEVADVMGIEFVYRLCAYLPLLGLLAVFLPALTPKASARV